MVIDGYQWLWIVLSVVSMVMEEGQSSQGVIC